MAGHLGASLITKAGTVIAGNQPERFCFADPDPFGGVDHSSTTNLNVTFLKRKPRTARTLPNSPRDRGYTILGMYGRDICSVVDVTSAKTPDLMQWMEKE